MRKRGEGMTVNTIVMMALALVVLAVLLFLTYKYVLKPGEQAGATGTCTGQGGTCKASMDCGNPDERGLIGLGCPEQGQPKEAVYCCVAKK